MTQGWYQSCGINAQMGYHRVEDVCVVVLFVSGERGDTLKVTCCTEHILQTHECMLIQQTCTQIMLKLQIIYLSSIGMDWKLTPPWLYICLTAPCVVLFSFAGMPQGSIPSLFLFRIYIQLLGLDSNDFRCYMDNTQMYVSIKRGILYLSSVMCCLSNPVKYFPEDFNSREPLQNWSLKYCTARLNGESLAHASIKKCWYLLKWLHGMS